MTTRTETITTRKEFAITGRYLELLETVQPVNVLIYDTHGHVLAYDRNVEAGYYHGPRDRDDPFQLVVIETLAAEEVSLLWSDGLTGTRRAFVSAAQARTLALPGNASVGVAEGVVLAAANRKEVVFKADPANAGVIYLGPVGVTIANAPIELAPGDVWIGEVAASAAWSAIATVAAQTLRIMTAE